MISDRLGIYNFRSSRSDCFFFGKRQFGNYSADLFCSLTKYLIADLINQP